MLGLRLPSAKSIPKIDPNGHYFGHAPASFLVKTFGYNHWRNVFSFGFVRNPWTRMVSVCARINPKALSSPETFTTWLKANCPDQRGSPHPVAQDTFMHQPCSEFIFPCTYIGRFETLAIDIKRICLIIGIQEPDNYVCETRGTGDHPVEYYYNEEGRALMLKLYKNDFINFGYPTTPDPPQKSCQ
jgi:hypothetical protein